VKANLALVAIILFVGAIVMALQGQGEISFGMSAVGILAMIIGVRTKN
jgi:hypothetical protein